jgi:hypothetical protein
VSDQETIAEAFRLLRELCDPRGHDLLGSLESLCISESIGLDAFYESFSKPDLSIVTAIDQYSKKVPS